MKKDRRSARAGDSLKAPVSTLCGLIALLGCMPAAAQTTLAAADAWQFEFIPYLWLTGIHSDLKLGPLPGSTLTVNSKSVVDALEAGAMGTFEARNGRWGGLLDVQYVKLGVSRQVAGGLLGGYDVEFKQTIATLLGFYRVIEGPVAIDLLGGIRYVDAKTDVDFSPSPRGFGRQIDEKVGSTDGVLGVRAIVPLDDKWSLMGYLDVGHGSSTSSWQAIAGASYQYSPTTSFKFGYRYLDYKRDDALLSKVALGGPYFGAGFKF